MLWMGQEGHFVTPIETIIDTISWGSVPSGCIVFKAGQRVSISFFSIIGPNAYIVSVSVEHRGTGGIYRTFCRWLKKVICEQFRDIPGTVPDPFHEVMLGLPVPNIPSDVKTVAFALG